MYGDITTHCPLSNFIHVENYISYNFLQQVHRFPRHERVKRQIWDARIPTSFESRSWCSTYQWEVAFKIQCDMLHGNAANCFFFFYQSIEFNEKQATRINGQTPHQLDFISNFRFVRFILIKNLHRIVKCAQKNNITIDSRNVSPTDWPSESTVDWRTGDGSELETITKYAFTINCAFQNSRLSSTHSFLLRQPILGVFWFCSGESIRCEVATVIIIYRGGRIGMILCTYAQCQK